MPIDRDFLHEYAKNPQVPQAPSSLWGFSKETVEISRGQPKLPGQQHLLFHDKISSRNPGGGKQWNYQKKR
jgi:hypothetical protein